MPIPAPQAALGAFLRAATTSSLRRSTKRMGHDKKLSTAATPRNPPAQVTASGKTISSLNGLKHGLTGQRMVLLPHEFDAYRRLCDALNADYNPQTEIEKQLVQHIADCNMRLNRIAAIESNMFSFGAANLCRGQAADSFEKLGRYEGRVSRQLLNYIRELERIQNLRQNQLQIPAKTTEKKADNTKMASLRQTIESLVPTETPRTLTAHSAAPAPAAPRQVAHPRAA